MAMTGKIEYYTQKNGKKIIKVYLKSTRKYKGRFFYTSIPSDEICRDKFNSTQKDITNRVMDLLNPQKYTWHVREIEGYENIVGYRISCEKKTYISFAEALYEAYQYQNIINNIILSPYDKVFKKDYRITFKNRVGYDCTDENLYTVSRFNIGLTMFCRGYLLDVRGFIPKILVGDQITSDKLCRSELDACIAQFDFENELRKNNPDLYIYNVLNDFRVDDKILQDLREGVIDKNTAELQLLDVKRKNNLSIKENAWYVYRYGLDKLFKDNDIALPEYKIGRAGYMVHSETLEKLCPLY